MTGCCHTQGQGILSSSLEQGAVALRALWRRPLQVEKGNSTGRLFGADWCCATVPAPTGPVRYLHSRGYPRGFTSVQPGRGSLKPGVDSKGLNPGWAKLGWEGGGVKIRGYLGGFVSIPSRFSYRGVNFTPEEVSRRDTSTR
jgi:hypothetical protein